MNPSSFQARRATVEDLLKLRSLWQKKNLPVADLEKRFTEFQLAESEDRILLGAIGLHIDQQQARLHSEAYTSEEVEEVCRLQLWQRVQSVVRNHGLFRVWTQAEEAFWPQNGFSQAEGQVLEKLPASFGDRSGRWFTLQLREESGPAISLDGEFELFTQAQREGTAKAMQQARVLKTLAYVLVLIFLLGVIAAGFYVFLHSPLPFKR